jgi:hypothetical protein
MELNKTIKSETAYAALMTAFCFAWAFAGFPALYGSVI